MYIIVAIIIFGVLIAIHELGHFMAAKCLGVRVNEFALGMGPAIYTRKKGETQFSLRILPLGGFCAMEGEDETSEDPRAFTSQKAWKRAVILVAGAFMNFVFGLLLASIILSQNSYFVTTTISGFVDGVEFAGEAGLVEGDKILRIDGEAIYTQSDIDLVMSRSSDEYYDIVVRRDGKRVTINDLHMAKGYYEIDGETEYLYGLFFGTEEKTVLSVIKHGWLNTIDFVKMVKLGLMDLVSGGVGIDEMSGVVGIVDTMNDIGQQSASTRIGMLNVLYLGAFIAVNLAVMNLLPLPALDGGRVFFLIVTAIIEKISRRKLDPKYEGYIHMAGLVLLVGLMILVMANDILKIIGIR